MLDGDWLVIVVGHGQPPRDMPRDILSEYLSLLHRHGRTKLEDERLAELTRVVMDWPRNSENDPYWSSLQTLQAAGATSGRIWLDLDNLENMQWGQ